MRETKTIVLLLYVAHTVSHQWHGAPHGIQTAGTLRKKNPFDAGGGIDTTPCNARAGSDPRVNGRV